MATITAFRMWKGESNTWEECDGVGSAWICSEKTVLHNEALAIYAAGFTATPMQALMLSIDLPLGNNQYKTFYKIIENPVPRMIYAIELVNVYVAASGLHTLFLHAQDGQMVRPIGGWGSEFRPMGGSQDTQAVTIRTQYAVIPIPPPENALDLTQPPSSPNWNPDSYGNNQDTIEDNTTTSDPDELIRIAPRTDDFDYLTVGLVASSAIFAAGILLAVRGRMYKK